eukprot:3825057-Rhodomonas_salina.7
MLTRAVADAVFDILSKPISALGDLPTPFFLCIRSTAERPVLRKAMLLPGETYHGELALRTEEVLLGLVGTRLASCLRKSGTDLLVVDSATKGDL